jgi:hypothetical protein
MDKTDERCGLLVEDAGSPEVNGEYSFDRIHNDAECYSKKGKYNGKDYKFGIYKSGVQSNFTWFMICAEENNFPISHTRIFYAKPGRADDRTVPQSPPWGTQQYSNQPPPKVSVIRVASHPLNSLLYENDYFKDFIIVYAGVQFKAHKTVLASSMSTRSNFKFFEFLNFFHSENHIYPPFSARFPVHQIFNIKSPSNNVGLFICHLLYSKI